MKQPEIRIETVSMRLIYIRFKGSYSDFRKESKTMVKKLFAYAGKYDMVDKSFTKVMTLYHDNPYITKGSNLRTSVAMLIPDDVHCVEEGDICEMTVVGKFGVGSFEISAKEYGEAWDYMYHEWLFKEAVTPRDAVPFELYVDEPPRNMKDTSHTDIYIPIE